LIADDDELVVELVRDALSARGHIVGAVDDGKMVVDIAIARQPDVLILDCTMPEVSGIEALRQIRLSPHCPTMPVMILTARRGQVDEDIAFRAGANDYMRKPFDVDALVSRIELLLERAERRKGIKAEVAICVPQVKRARRWGER
jgi:DNA-binding response OmpR family regulator